jgi:hypothetical protein
MEVFKTYLFFEDSDEGHAQLVDTIFHEDSWWLVGSWLAHAPTRTRVPERIVRLSGLRFQEVKGQPFRFLLNNPLPKSVLDGESQAGYVVAMYPGLSGGSPPKEEKPH